MDAARASTWESHHSAPPPDHAHSSSTPTTDAWQTEKLDAHRRLPPGADHRCQAAPTLAQNARQVQSAPLPHRQGQQCRCSSRYTVRLEYAPAHTPRVRLHTQRPAHRRVQPCAHSLAYQRCADADHSDAQPTRRFLPENYDALFAYGIPPLNFTK